MKSLSPTFSAFCSTREQGGGGGGGGGGLELFRRASLARQGSLRFSMLA